MTETYDSARNEMETTPEETSSVARGPLIIWAGVSIVFLVYVFAGSIEARIWTYGRLTFQERGITHVWRYFGDRLPDMPGGPLIPILYYLSLAVIIIGTIAGIGLFLLPADDDDGRVSTSHE